MSEEWYSRKPQNRFSREHRSQLPAGARMVDIDGLVWAPYIKGQYGGPLMLVEFKPDNAKEDFWLVTRQLARMAGLPAARVIEQRDHRYTVHVAADDGYAVHEVGRDMTVMEWYEQVERPLRERAGHRLSDAA